MSGSPSRPGCDAPTPDLGAREVLTLVLRALAANDSPRTDHGIGVSYAFASDRMRGGIGDEAAFGRALHNTLNAPLLGHDAAEVESFERRGDAARAEIRVTGGDGAVARFTVALTLARHGVRANCWLVSGLARAGVDL